MDADVALLEWLAGLDEKELAGVLAVRPDVLLPVPPRRLAELADRLDDPESVYLVLSRSPVPCLVLAQAVLVAALAGRPLAALMPEGFDYAGELDELERRALVWREGEGLRICSALHEVLPAPLGLGPSLTEILTQITVAELADLFKRLGGTGTGRKAVLVDSITAILADDERLAQLVARAPQGTRELLDDFAWRGPAHILDEPPHVGYHARPGRMTPARWAREHGLIWSVDWEGAHVMPMEVALALRGRDYRVDVSAERPAITTGPVAAELVAHEASVAALRVLDRAAALLEAVSAEPLPELKGGGVGVKEVRRLAKQLGCAEDEIRLLLDIADAAGLLAANPVTEVRIRRSTEVRRNGVSPTDGYDGWLALGPAERFATLVEAWWGLAVSPTRSYDGKARTPMTPAGPGTPSSLIREVVFGLLPSDAEVRLPQEVVAAASWHLPLISPESVAEVVSAVLAEGRLLGLIGANALSPLGLALRTGSVAEAADKMLAQARQQALFGADMTAVVTGPPSADLAEVLDRAADRESGGSAGTWRFTPSSVRRALDAGHRAEDLLAALTEVASGALPQALTYLINDVARRHGEIGVVALGCCVVGDDQGLMAELAVHRKLARLRPRLLAPTVLASTLNPAQTLALLREAGYAPVAMEADGSLAVTTPAIRRAPQRRARPKAPVAGPESAAAWLIGTAGVREPEPGFHRLTKLFTRHATGLAAEARARAAMELQYYGQARIVYDGENLTISSPEAHGAELDVWCHETGEFRRLDPAKISAFVS
ncbi:helicase-associated domain-containing protein [Microbispora sp. NPDC049125]|uniref:helicase-associated domain-containing protein n=1 Tax=Microbispora sp. NPDC049125 TaxID=3154929 RepID=UPI003467C039